MTPRPLVWLFAACLSAETGAAQMAPLAPPAGPAAPAVVTPAAMRDLPRLKNVSTRSRTVEVHLTASPSALSLIPGTTCETFAYNGSVPGPVLEVNEGDSVIVHFRNELAEVTTVHWHGLHIPFAADGSPFHPVAPGETHDYVFRIPRGSAGTYWYHPHPHHRTGYQVSKGLYGAIIVRAADDPLPVLPEKLIILSDNRFKADGAIDIPDMHTPEGRVDMENGREGDRLFVNGQLSPVITIRSGEVQRWRVINASAARVYRLALRGHTLVHVGNDGGLFEEPREVREITIANGERVELLVFGSEAPGSVSVFETLPYDRYIPQMRPTRWNEARPLLSLQYTAQSPMEPPAIPRRLRFVPPLDTAQATAVRIMSLSQGLINGKLFDMDRVDVRAKLGATEIWQVENLVGMDHPFHLHGFQFQVIDRNGVPEPYRSWKDMVNVPKHETARFIVRYDDHAGKWMFHCHILDHEDHGMMGILEVER